MIYLKIADEPSSALSGMPPGKAAMKGRLRALNHVPTPLKPARASMMPPSRTDPSDSDQSGGEELTISGKHTMYTTENLSLLLFFDQDQI